MVFSCRTRLATIIVREVKAREIQGKGRMRARVGLLILGLLRYIREMGSLHAKLVEEISNKPPWARPTTHIRPFGSNVGCRPCPWRLIAYFLYQFSMQRSHF